MFAEIIEVTKFAYEILSSKNSKPEGWRRIFQLYLSLDKLIAEASLVLERDFSRSIDEEYFHHSTTFNSPVEKWTTLTNDSFKRLDEAFNEFLENFSRVSLILDIYDEKLKNALEFHIAWKSAWRLTYRKIYLSGEVNKDGKQLSRKWLKMSEKVGERFQGYVGNTSMEDVTQKYLVNELFDISTPEQKQQLINLAQRNLEELRRLKKDFGEFIKANCTIDSLLSEKFDWG